MITVSVQLSALLGKRVVLTSEFEGYSVGSTAVVEEFVTTAKGPFFRLQFETLPGSLEEVEPLMLCRVSRLLRAGDTVGHSLFRYFRQGMPPRDRRFNLVVG